MPTTMTGCVALARSAEGDEALTLVAAIISNILAIGVTPLVLMLTVGESAPIDAVSVFQKLALLVVLPLAGGQTLRRLTLPTPTQGFWSSQAVQAFVLLILLVVAIDTGWTDQLRAKAPAGPGGQLRQGSEALER